METYEYTVTLKVKVEAFSKEDADDIIEDVFGLGEDCGANIVESKVGYSGPANR